MATAALPAYQEPACSYREEKGQAKIALRGSWRIAFVADVTLSLQRLPKGISPRVTLDGAELEAIDSAGALLVYHALADRGVPFDNITLEKFSPALQALMQLVQRSEALPKPNMTSSELGFLQRVGKRSIVVTKDFLHFLSFLGQTLEHCLFTLLRPRSLRLREFFVQLEATCVNAIPVVCLVTLLIGVVIAYLFAAQIEKYGANIFIVDAVSMAMCRELSPIIVAIIVAGRSGSAFTAQLGTMKMNEEIDAMITLDLSPFRVLIVPRVLALMVAMPILVFIGDIVGIFGGLVIADARLGITSATFIDRLHTILPVRFFWVGMFKAPVFAAFIAMIGCRMGLNVENNARSVGTHTTSTVVQSIVAVILLNAAFAIILVEMGI